MNKLLKSIEEHQADIMPATAEQIRHAEQELGTLFSKEYKEYLLTAGVISYGAWETYGLGVPQGSYLNIISALRDFKQIGNLSEYSVPLMDIGDGHYYIYDNQQERVTVWALPGGQLDKTISGSLEDFLVSTIFS